MAAPLHFPRHSPAESGAPIAGVAVLAFEPPAILTVPEVAVELRCSKAHVHNLINGLVYAGVNGTPRGFDDPKKANLGPRVGFAYRLASKAVLRGGLQGFQ